MLDGYLNQCKECVKANANQHRNNNIERIKEYDRNRPNAKQRNEINKARYKENMRNPEYREKDRRRVKGWQENNHIKRAAHIITGNAVRNGKLIKQPCEICGELKVEGHHDDYEKPLEVRWLCISHHAEHHRQEREKQRREV